MTDLRNHLFETLEALKDEEKPMEIARARAISEVAQTIIQSAKVEVEFLQISGESEASEFFDALRANEPLDLPRPPLRLTRGRRSV